MEQEEKNKKEIDEVKKDISEAKETVLDNSSPAGKSLGLKITIGVLVVLILGLTGWVFYQSGKKSIVENDKVETPSGDKKVESKTNDLTKNSNNQAQEQQSNNTQNATDDKSENTSETSNKTLSEDTVDDMEKELNDIDNGDDDMEGVEDDLTDWLK